MAEPKNKNKTIATKLHAQNKENLPSQEPSHCILCGQLGPPLSHGHWICEHCKIVVQAEILSKKRKIEKEGGGPV
jgi:transposase